MFHVALHFIVPALVAWFGFIQQWRLAFFIMAATIVVDLDHLLAQPIYDPNRCSIGFHPLHGFLPISTYLLVCFLPKLRMIGIGLIIHMGLDSIDCFYTNGVFYT
ncbi:MAG: DUF6122 family protein [Gammaproteobacteria bacterium]